ncbi:MAG: lytic transglycosylase domain-containing protein [Thermodesulfovibrionales bacterium]|nr:lytic transglycosylase domain-containing protein [Thermodesulfovibrionales bacterium]
MVALLVIAIILFAGINADAGIYKSVSDDGIVCFTNSPTDRNSRLLINEGKDDAYVNKPAKSSVKKESLFDIAETKAKQHNLDPQLVKAVIKAESNWNPAAISPKGAQGLMQLMPSTAFMMGVHNPFNPEENIDGGTKYLKHLLERFNGNLTLALAAYNAGPKLVENKRAVPSIPETVNYVKKVLAYYKGSSVNIQDVQNEIKREINRIKKVILEDGTVLFTNSYFLQSHH